MSKSNPCAPRSAEQLRHVGVVLEAVVHDDPVEALASGFDSKRSSSRHVGTSSVTTVRNTTRSCSTLLCFRLCSRACGTPSGVAGEEHRRARRPASAAMLRRLWMNRSSGIASAVRRFDQHRAPALPGRQHDEHDDADREREPAAVGDLDRVRREEREVDQHEGRRRWPARASGGQRHSRRITTKSDRSSRSASPRHRDAVGAGEIARGAEADHQQRSPRSAASS